ncbi:DUF885 domain-containing protein [Brachybacterium sp. EF45031]|uniref:DUF885 domain-containing protein n=1 Tax=Brachybacterium sillae TaxID=2810536 RepID=UPI00217D09E6|nr:DUF885 domain-containing protein [Brachybacterium sillae]MCS6711056.1 DUF885 domain-containing protein [Brachybacterium sillae]
MTDATTADRTRTALDALADEYVEDCARRDPFLATSLGVPGHDDQVTDYSPQALQERAEAARALLARIAQVRDEDEVDAVTRAALQERLGVEMELHEALVPHAQVNNLASPLQSRDVLDLMPTESAQDWEVMAARLERFPQALTSWAESLRFAADRGVLWARRQLELGAAQARSYADPDSGFFARLGTGSGLDGDLAQAVREGAAKAARAYLDLAEVLEELAPRAPEKDSVGREAYALHSRVFLGEQVDLDETYAWGVEELRRIIAEQEEVAARINDHYGTGAGRSVEAARAALRADPARVLHGREALQAWMQELSDRAVADLADTHFDIPEPLRRLECRIGETGSGGIYYTGPSEDLTRPGRMWWDVADGVDDFDTWSETTTVYHEGVPGHHLQVGTQTLQGQRLNRWRSLMCWTSGHGEGWALYAERLMEQLGYLEDDGDRLGMLDAQRFRAGRVVLDIGLHCELPMPQDLPGSAGGRWDYDSAWQFVAAHWSDPEPQRRFELHRYLGWPGQAPSYKVGQRLWEQLRADSDDAGVDPRDFHRRALELGSLPLSVLREALR